MRDRFPITLLIALLLAGSAVAGQGETAQEKKDLRHKTPDRTRGLEQPRVERMPERSTPIRPRPNPVKPRRDIPDRPPQPRRDIPDRPDTPPADATPADTVLPLPDVIDFGPIVDPVPFPERRFVEISSPAGICELSLEDEYLAWRLADVTSLPFWEIAAARREGWTWPTVLRELEMEPRDMELALEFRAGESLGFDWGDEDVFARVLDLSGNYALPEVECADGIWLTPPSPYERFRVDERILEIGQRIAGQTGFSVNLLLRAHREYGHWAEVARAFSLSPFLFEVEFDVQLPGVWRGDTLHLDYPSDRVLREAVGGSAEQLPMSWSAEAASDDGMLKTGLKWATFLGIVSLIGGITG